MNSELKQMWKEDRVDSKETSANPVPEQIAKYKKNNEARKKRIDQLLEDGSLIDPMDFVHASWIFHQGKGPQDYKKANEFAQKAVELSETGTLENNSARWIYAASLDRYLLSIGQPQKFGTQFDKDPETGKLKLSPYDPNTTDQERAEYFVPSLSESLKKESII